MHTIKPIDKHLLEAIHTLKSRQIKLLFSVEDHNIIGGLGTAIAEILAEIPNSIPLYRIGVQDKFGRSGSYTELLEEYDLSVNQISKFIIEKFESATKLKELE